MNEQIVSRQIRTRCAHPDDKTQVAFEKYLILRGYKVTSIGASSNSVFGTVVGKADVNHFTQVKTGTMGNSWVRLSYQDWRNEAITNGLMDQLY